jgi:type I restriction enzyme S subunit
MIPRVHLAEVAEINPRLPKGANEAQKVSFLAMASISEDGKVLEQETRILGETKKGYTYFERGDILLAKITPCFENGKAALVDNLEHPIGFGSTEFHVLRPDAEQLNAKYLFYLLWNDRFRLSGQKVMKGAAGHKRVPVGFLNDFEIPLPPLDDQIRIAHLLGKVDGLIVQRKQHLHQLDELLKSVFLDMFGDPVLNEKGWDTLPFSQVGKFASGGTPSKSRDDFWSGDYPWVSPKDMKLEKIFDSEDHISECVFKETSLKRIAPGHLLVVVRGMILAHSFPVAINMVDVAINQDMKAVKIKNGLRVVYVQHCLISLKRQILKLVTTAGHGTKKFDSDAMEKLLIPVPPEKLQDKFLVISEKIDGIKSLYQQSLADLEALYGTLSQQAYKGELDFSCVPLPAMKLEEYDPAAIEPRHSFTTEIVVKLPYIDNLPGVLPSSQAREALIMQWLEAYHKQLGASVFSIQRFMIEAQTHVDELYPDADFELGAKDYEHIRTWVFEALADGRLKQSRNITGEDKEGRPIFGNRIQLKAGQT